MELEWDERESGNWTAAPGDREELNEGAGGEGDVNQGGRD